MIATYGPTPYNRLKRQQLIELAYILEEQRDKQIARADQAEAALEAGDPCGAVGCRALGERDRLRAGIEALADEWDRKAEEHVGRAVEEACAANERLIQAGTAGGRMVSAADLRALLAAEGP